MSERLSASASSSSSAPTSRPASDHAAADEPPTPRWVKVSAIIAGVLALLVVVMVLAGHNPARHLHSHLGGGAPSGVQISRPSSGP